MAVGVVVVGAAAGGLGREALVEEGVEIALEDFEEHIA